MSYVTCTRQSVSVRLLVRPSHSLSLSVFVSLSVSVSPTPSHCLSSSVYIIIWQCQFWKDDLTGKYLGQIKNCKLGNDSSKIQKGTILTKLLMKSLCSKSLMGMFWEKKIFNNCIHCRIFTIVYTQAQFILFTLPRVYKQGCTDNRVTSQKIFLQRYIEFLNTNCCMKTIEVRHLITSLPNY